ncbi:MAG: EAL domain-containing protein [Sulfurovum sp.]|nr:EAL domain-containing protein [Sulfurovum sp.]
MLLSELNERERRFKLALRAGIPVLLLTFLVFYSLFTQEGVFKFNLLNSSLIAAIVFITIYFNYFLIEMSVKESIIDNTTQSYNEKAFLDKLHQYKPKTLVLLVVDNLYTINDAYSADKVDLLLYTIIHKLNHTLNQYGVHSPLIGRRYGAEFLIAINKEDHDVKEIFEKFIEQNHTINEIEVDYAFSAATNTGENIEQILGQLKDILITEEDNDEKKNTVKPAEELGKTEQNILEALQNKQFKMSFRPLESTQTKEIEIYEIVSKLAGQNQEEILPRVYLPIINRLGLGVEYDLSLVEHIIKLLPLIDEKISFTFNLSPFSLRNIHFQEKFFSLLDAHNIKSSRLIIQLYERKTHHDLSGYFKTLSTFRKKGVRICIDNFGSSNASMEYMKNFKFDMVQFDREYVTKLEDQTTLAMLSSLITMSQDLNILTVAKWVDKEKQKDKLSALGISYLQGFGIAKPIKEQALIQTYN